MSETGWLCLSSFARERASEVVQIFELCYSIVCLAVIKMLILYYWLQRLVDLWVDWAHMELL